MLQIAPDHFTRTSDYFDKILEYCEQLLSEEKAYVDDTDAESMRTQRLAREKSGNRDNSTFSEYSLSTIT